ncbi:hypothetical protein EJ03DRAFT_176191 [Teratosphaeria nubilosa]|uniref:Uncharacterized protein n=1 Tax=Teratosphaeria nubilosa TaxID=161662 RepID=A0A6G1L161_9PEZI|nr:hypothetical protein EJ03DRAFT_176191 [Teratosphaeria nubilosa]
MEVASTLASRAQFVTPGAANAQLAEGSVNVLSFLGRQRYFSPAARRLRCWRWDKSKGSRRAWVICTHSRRTGLSASFRQSSISNACSISRRAPLPYAFRGAAQLTEWSQHSGSLSRLPLIQLSFGRCLTLPARTSQPPPDHRRGMKRPG